MKVSAGDMTGALSLDPRRARAFYVRGVAEHMRGRIDAAIEDFDRAVCKLPGSQKGQKTGMSREESSQRITLRGVPTRRKSPNLYCPGP